jgi:hypothetical protein
VATIIATFVISMIAFQPTATEASNNVSPTATPSPRGKRPIAIQSPITKVKTRTTKNPKWEVSELDAFKNKSAKPRSGAKSKKQ